jgi:hypothetical protein
MSDDDPKPDLDLGDGHWLLWTEYEGDAHAGANVSHLTKSGERCNGFITIEGSTWHKAFDGKTDAWKMESLEPLTLSPSILCRACGDHGFIRGGKWVRA